MCSGVNQSDILATNQPTKKVADARIALYYTIARLLPLTAYQIAKHFNKHPSGIRYSIKQGHNLVQVDSDFRQLIFDISTNAYQSLNQPSKATT